MKKVKYDLVELRGGGDLRELQASAQSAYDDAYAAGRLRVMHPVTGKVVSAQEFEEENKRYREHGTSLHEYWRTPVHEIGKAAVKATEITVNHQELATLDDHRAEMLVVYPGDRHIVGVDAA